jgi:protein-S-isoprenylcysteine O-methyltransferase Ste14
MGCDESDGAAMIPTPIHFLRDLWVLLGVYWLLAAFRRTRIQKREPILARLGHLLVMAAASVLLAHREPWWGILNERFVPQAVWIAWVGVGLTAAGVAVAIWARRHLGKYWSAEVTIRSGHELIRTGPYAHIRHPIYTGILLALVGTVLVIGEYRALAAMAIAVIGFVRKAKKEDSFLEGQFGAAFEAHRRLTGFFLPRFS